MAAQYTIRKLCLPTKHLLGAELGKNAAARVDEFEQFYKNHTTTLKIKAKNGEIPSRFFATLSLRQIRCWQRDANVAYIFTNEQTLTEWSRKQSFYSAEEEAFLTELRGFLKRVNRRTFEMLNERYIFKFGGPTRIMGVLNVTPDSFHDGGENFSDAAQAIRRGVAMAASGADIIDVGGESTRPGALPVDEAEEAQRVVPVIQGLAEEVNVPISIDTYKSHVAEAAIQAGATIINDISGLQFDPQMPEVLKHYGAPLIMMHIKGEPRNMQLNPTYENLMDELYEYFEERIVFAVSRGVDRAKIIIDPGLGFGKRLWDNYEIVQRLSEFKGLGCPVMIGPSRKSFIGKVLELPPEERLEGTAGFVAAAVGNSHIVRVHDVKEMLRVVQIADLLAGNVIVESQELQR